MTGIETVIVASVPGLLAGLVAYLVARNQTEAKVRESSITTAAAAASSNATLLDQREARIYAEQNRQTDALKAEVEHGRAVLEAEGLRCKTEIARLSSELIEVRKENGELRGSGTRLAEELAKLVKSVSDAQTAATVASMVVPLQQSAAAPIPPVVAPGPTVVGDIVAESLTAATMRVTDQQAATIADAVVEVVEKKDGTA